MKAPRRTTRVAVLDDHPAIRAGVQAMIADEPDLTFAGSAATAHELWPLLRRTQPEVLVLDIDHPGHDGLSLALRLSTMVHGPRVVLYTARDESAIAVAAAFAGAQAVVDKTADRLTLLAAVRDGSPWSMDPPSAADRTAAAALLDPADHAILAMRLARTSPAEIAATLGLPVERIARRSVAILGRLRGAPDDGPERRSGARATRKPRRPAARRPLPSTGSFGRYSDLPQGA